MEELINALSEPLNQLIALTAALLFYGLCYSVRLTGGKRRTKKQKVRWSWERFWDDLSFRLSIGYSMVAAVIACDVAYWMAPLLGITFSDTAAGKINAGLIIGLPFIAGLNELVAGIKLLVKFWKYKENMEALEMTANNIDYNSANYQAITSSTVQMVNNIVTALYTPKEAVEAHNKFEESGGLGAVFVLDISSYAAFRTQVLGKGYDVDGYYGYQCWDGCALLWQQLGKSLLTGGDNARGCWTRMRDQNAGTEFGLITDVTKIKRGMVLVFGTGQYGHIGFADEDYHGGNYIRLLGQNQGGTPVGVNGGAGFNVINMSLVTFLGAFVYKPWLSGQQPDTPTPNKPTVSGQNPDKSTTIKKGDYVRVLKYVDVNGTALMQLQSTPYLVYQSSPSTRTAVLKSDDGDIYARISWDNIQKAQ